MAKAKRILVKDHRSKHLYDGTQTIDQMLDRIKDEIIMLEELQEYKVKLTNISDEGWTHFEVQVDYDDDMSADYLRNTHGFEDEMENA